MEKFLRPERLDIEPDDKAAEKQWKHWLKTFSNFMAALSSADHSPDRLSVLINFISSRVYDYIADCTSYDEAILLLQSYYVKPKSIIYARHLLSTRKQESSETLDQYLIQLKQLSLNCDFTAVSATQNRDEAIRDSMITGLRSSYIRQRLLENKTLTLSEAYDQARTLESAQLQAETYRLDVPSGVTAEAFSLDQIESTGHTGPPIVAVSARKSLSGARCYFCGFSKHPRTKCPARDATCHLCTKRRHFSKVCKSIHSQSNSPTSSSTSVIATLIAAAPACLNRALIPVIINGVSTKALIDTGSSESFLSLQFAKNLKVKVSPCALKISMASTMFSALARGFCNVSLQYDSADPVTVKLNVLEDLCADIILGHDILKNHHSIEVTFNGKRPSLKVCGLAAATVPSPSLFANLATDWRPIVDKSRQYSSEDMQFIKKEIVHLMKEDIIEPSSSPWRAQVLVTGGNKMRKRMVVDYSRTI